MKILLACFSATGNTATIARVLQKRLEELGAGVDLLDITTPEGRDHSRGMAEYQAAVFGAPIHCMRAPRIVRERMAGLKGQGTPCALFFTYGGFQVHPAHAASAEILRRNGFTMVASAEFPAKHTYNLFGWQAMADRPGPAELRAAREYADLIHGRFSGWDGDRVGQVTQSKRDPDRTRRIVVRRTRHAGWRERIQRGQLWELTPGKALEAATGFEPVNNGFADRCLSHLAMPPAERKGGSFRPPPE